MPSETAATHSLSYFEALSLTQTGFIHRKQTFICIQRLRPQEAHNHHSSGGTLSLTTPCLHILWDRGVQTWHQYECSGLWRLRLLNTGLGGPLVYDYAR